MVGRTASFYGRLLLRESAQCPPEAVTLSFYGRLLLRESAQCPPEDEDDFQDVTKHKFFNTNNLWLDLEALKKECTANQGALPLPVMKNSKTVR